MKAALSCCAIVERRVNPSLQEHRHGRVARGDLVEALDAFDLADDVRRYLERAVPRDELLDRLGADDERLLVGRQEGRDLVGVLNAADRRPLTISATDAVG